MFHKKIIMWKFCNRNPAFSRLLCKWQKMKNALQKYMHWTHQSIQIPFIRNRSFLKLRDLDCLVLGFALHACKVAGILRELLSLFKGCDLYTDHEKHCRHGNIPSGVRRSLLIRFFFPQRKSSSLLNSPEHISSLEDYYCIH